MKHLSCGLAGLFIVLLAGCNTGTGAPVATSPTLHRYQVKVSGKSGVTLDLLIIWKPVPGNGPQRAIEHITVPFTSKIMSGTAAYAWVDNAKGNLEDLYTVELFKDEKPNATIEGKIVPGKMSGGLGDL